MVRYDVKSVDGIVKSWVGSSIFMDWSIEVAEMASSINTKVMIDKNNCVGREKIRELVERVH